MTSTPAPVTLNDCVQLCKSAGVLAGDHEGGEVISVEVVDLYNAGYAQFEVLVNSPDVDKVEVLTQWGIALTDNFKLKGTSREEEMKLYELATQKFENAMLTASTNSHEILYHWGNLLLIKGRKEKSWGENEEAQNSLSLACGKFSNSFANKSDYVVAVEAWKLALTEQSKLVDGNQRFWFESQISEKSKWIEKLHNNEKIDLPTKIELSPQEKLKKGAEEKELGNGFFKKAEFTGALKHYHNTLDSSNALNYANGLYGLPPADDKALKDLKTSIYNNMAIVHMKQNKNDRAITDLKLVLELDGNNVKALYRRGKLWLATGDVDRARADLEKAKGLDPSSKEILQEFVLLEKKEKEQLNKQKGMYAKMFQ